MATSLQDAYIAAEHSLINTKPLDETVAQQLPAAVRDAVDDILHGRYAKLIQHSPLFEETEGFSAPNILEWVDQRLKSLLPQDQPDSRFQMLATGIACLNAFIQINWTGPVMELGVEQLFTKDKEIQKTLERDIHSSCLRLLSADSEEVYHLTQQLGFLAVARQILVSEELRKKTVSGSLWATRACFIQQQLLEEGSATLQNLILQLTGESAENIKNSLNKDAGTELIVRQQLETALMYSHYGQDKEAYEKMCEGQESSGFTWSITGALGRRTKFQQFDVTQLVVLAESKHDAEESKEESTRPETLDLNDDTLLEKIAFAKTEENEKDEKKRLGNLRVIDQCLLLAFCLNIKNTNPDHGLTTEQMKPYVARVLENANNWMVHTMALLLKTRLESDKSRTVERSALQLQALVDQIKVEDSGVEERLAYFYDLLLPSKWEMERELARRFVSLGVLRSALEIFERLEMWDDVVSCYQLLEQRHKAKEVLDRLMAENPDSPKLWCILGDVEREPEHWRKSWELSGRRYARAMRTLGAYHYKLGEYNESIESYQLALEINPLFEGSWYVLGCAAMQAERWDVAQRAFQRVVALDNEQAEAWNNLSSVYVRMDRKLDAFLALKQATKLKFDNWKMWQNLLFVAVDVGQFADAIWAMQRIVDLRWDKVREEAVDIPVLRLIVESVIQNWKDLHDRDGVRLAGQVQRLLEDVILSRITNSAEIWRICAKYYMWQQRYADGLEASIKAYRAVMHDTRIETEESIFEDVATIALDTVDMYETLGDKQQGGKPVCADWKYQSRLIIKGLMGKTKDTFEDTVTYERLQERLDDLKRS
ncbi:hypothetical protein DFQ28_004552 [Apophysomyces sp. BC1034]|nr:hypothetical protein DFQ30_006945 [Apophysomyces sp. BC1015]KAG0176017.1 hypothetical protein DFQ29_006651 [Apophysomyces sp. BC1021]KAG0188661.1 hypothetical protein DFQ28_004552 [Apophysomyces sp. BC1034]